VLGYIAYVLICAFGPIQLFNMIHGRNIELGNLPLFTLIAGLALLQLSIMRDAAPTYVLVGNGAVLIFNLINLAWVGGAALYTRRQVVQRIRNTRYTLTPAGQRKAAEILRHIKEVN
jgi:hypothetical protein